MLQRLDATNAKGLIEQVARRAPAKLPRPGLFDWVKAMLGSSSANTLVKSDVAARQIEEKIAEWLNTVGGYGDTSPTLRLLVVKCATFRSERAMRVAASAGK